MFSCAARCLSAAAAVKVPTDVLKALRERTGAPLMDCKNALAESNLDIEKAVDALRKKGAVHASKAAGRQASSGLVAAVVAADGRTAAVVELNCETDFVERNERFQVGLQAIAHGVLASVATDASAAAAATGAAADLELGRVNAAADADGKPIGDTVNMLIAAIRENIVLRRATSVAVAHGVVGAYVHNSVRAGLGRVAALVSLRTSAAAAASLSAENRAALRALADKLAMHAAGVKPLYSTRASVPADAVAREEAIHLEAVAKLKKPESVAKNIVAGKMGKFYAECVLAEQPFAVPSGPAEEVSVAKLIANEAARLQLKPTDIVRWRSVSSLLFSFCFAFRHRIHSMDSVLCSIFLLPAGDRKPPGLDCRPDSGGRDAQDTLSARARTKSSCHRYINSVMGRSLFVHSQKTGANHKRKRGEYMGCVPVPSDRKKSETGIDINKNFLGDPERYKQKMAFPSLH